MRNKKLKISEVLTNQILSKNELVTLQGGEAGLFCTSGGNCNCGTNSAKRNVRKSWRKFNKRCGSSGSST